MKRLQPWTRWLIWLSVRDALPMWLRRRCGRLTVWLLNRGLA